MRSVLWVVGLIAVAGCDDKPTPKRFEGPMPVTFGDCASVSTAWVTGPRPLPFKPDEAKDIWVAADGTSAATKPDAAAAPSQADAERARARALEAARSAGVLGVVASSEGGAFASLTGDVITEFDDPDAYGGLLGDESGAPGGLGMSGTGPQNGGPSWGSIGTMPIGRYGTVGHKSGTGVGYSPGGGYAFRRARMPPTIVSIGQPHVEGVLDKAILRRYIKRNVGKLQYCYEKQLLVNAALSGTVTAEFFITPNGEVASAKATGVDPAVSSCIASVLKSVVYPKPKDGNGVLVSYPFTFRSDDVRPIAAGGAGVLPGSATGSAGNAGSASDAGSATAPPVAPPAEERRRLFRATDVQTAAPYQPGALNPLRPERAAFETCFRASATHAGVAVFELVYDPAGKAERATVHGLDDPKLVTCLTSAASKVKSMGATGIERCSLAFGELPLSTLPSLDISADAITLGTTKLTTTEAVISQSSPGKVPAIFDAIAARVKKVTAASAPVVSRHGPLVLRPVDTTKMNVVTSAVASVIAAGDDLVFASQSGSEWTLLTPMSLPLPLVPVPFGTGGMWNDVKVPGRGASESADRTVLSVHIGKSKVALAVSKSWDVVSFSRDATAVQALGDALKARKASPDFANRDDIEIAIDGELTYADYVAVVRAAIAAGFTHWRYTEAGSLAASALH